ncbi:MAG TPA: hypothetical protein VLH15_11425 [Dehalococcoidales bacterium]|nr:hypothetical protein [Dehalococcoidales bacterium]
MSEYSIENFLTDIEKVIPVFTKYRYLETLEKDVEKPKPEEALKEVAFYFRAKYGNKKGTDYQLRFFSVMQFLEHHNKELFDKSLVKEDSQSIEPTTYNLLYLLLSSFKSPQPPSPFPSFRLFNRYREFNIKKVLKEFKSGRLQV